MRKPAPPSKPAPAKASAPVVAGPPFPVWLIAALLALVTIALYWPATGHAFVNLDDDLYVLDNPHVTTGLTSEGLKWAFFRPDVSFGYWHPLTLLSHMLDCQLFGLNPWGHHLTSVLLHALNAVLVFGWLRQMTGATWRSLLVAALFALHPLRVESVAWVAERKDVLSACFGLLALVFYARYAQVQSQPPESRNTFHVSRFTFHVSLFYLLSLSFFALGLLSKPMLVTWPFVLLLLDYWPLRRFALRTQNSKLKTLLPLLWEKLPFFALAAGASVLTFVLSKHAGALAAVESLPLGARAGNALISYCRYLGKLFWPTDLAVYYPHPGHWPLAKVLLAGGLLVGLSGLFWVQQRRFPFLLMGWLWFVGMLVPAIGLVQVYGFAMADRYTYIPSLGVLILAVWGGYELARRWRPALIALSVAGSAAIVLWLVVTRQQLGYWKDSESLFRHALEVTENNDFAHNNLGAALSEKGQIDEPHHGSAALALGLGAALSEKGQIDEAIRQYQEALRLKPGYAYAHNNLGTALRNKGQLDDAIRQYQEALRLKPDYAEACYNLGTAFYQQGRTGEAIRQYQQSIRLKPDYADAHNNLGAALAANGQIAEAISQYQEALRLRPDDAEAHNNLGIGLAKKGQMDEAIRQFQEALRLKPDYANAHNNLGRALAKKGQIAEAIRQLQEAIRLKPEDALAHNNLGTALYDKGQTDEAIRQFQESLRLKPDYAQARTNLARALRTNTAPPDR
jgi:tetratricopeptide (TPR) repeat protein